MKNEKRASKIQRSQHMKNEKSHRKFKDLKTEIDFYQILLQGMRCKS